MTQPMSDSRCRYAATYVILSIALVIVVARSATAEETERKPTFAPDSNGLYAVQCFRCDSLYQSLAAGGNIYLCQIADVRVDSLAGSGIEYGQLKLRISQVLLGSPTKELLVPFSRPSPNAFAAYDHSDIWDNSIIFEAHREICVVLVPNSYDRGAKLIPGVTSGVSHVFITAAAPLDESAFINRICTLEKSRRAGNRLKLLTELQNALADKSTEVGNYAVDVLVGDLLEEFPKSVSGVLRDVLMQANEIQATKGIVGRIIAAIRYAVRNESLKTEARIAMVQCMATVASDAQNFYIRSISLKNFAVVIAWEPLETPAIVRTRGTGHHAFPFKASDVLSPDQTARLRTYLNELATDPKAQDEIRVLRHWLDTEH